MEHGTFQEYQARLRVENAAMTCPVGRRLVPILVTFPDTNQRAIPRTRFASER